MGDFKTKYDMLIKFYRFLIHPFNSLLFLLLFSSFVNGQEIKQGTDFNSLVGKADTYYAQGDYINAKLYYQYAERMKPDEEYPKEKMEMTIKKLHEKMKLLDQYTAVIVEADELTQQQEFDKAIAKYKQAAAILPSEGYPEDKIAAINQSINDEHHKKFAYDDAIYRAEKFLKYDKYEQAIEQYEKAAALFPDNPFPAEQLETLNAQLDELIEAQKGYDEVIANADRLFQLNYYEEAREAYVKAQKAKPGEKYTEAKIKEIDEILVEKSDYDQKIALADSLYMEKQLQASKTSYQAALSIYPSENYPQDMIDKVNASLMKLMSKDELYSEAIAQADTFYLHLDYANALKEYENASNIRSSAKYPKEKITEIETLLAKQDRDERDYALSIKRGDQYVAVKKWANARQEYEAARKLKPGELYAAEKLAQIDAAVEQEKANQESYNNSLSKANNLLADGKLDEAEAEYKNALIIMPDDERATAQLEEIKNLRKVQEENASEYSRLLAQADDYFDKEKYQEAIDAYTAAQDLDDSDTYISLQISVASQKLKQRNETNNAYNKAIASADIFYKNKEYDQAYDFYEQASRLKPGSDYPKQKMASIASNQKAEKKSADDSYDAAIKKADELYQSEKYSQAKLAYLKASKIKPGEAYPTSRINEIMQMLSDREIIEASYNKYIGIADRQMAKEDFDNARMNYTQASELKPGEAYPKDQLSKIDARQLKGEISTQDTYNDLISKADQSVKEKDYEAALISYRKALKLKPGEAYPSNKIKEVETLQGDLQKDQDQYNRLIADADREFTSKNWKEAKTAYIKASALFPKQEHPKNRIDEINLIFKNQSQELQASYDIAIADADKLYAAGSLPEALASYKNAQAILPDESYPGEMITNIRETLDNLAARDLLPNKVTIKNNEKKKFSFDPLEVVDRKNSILLIRVRGMGIRAFKVFVSYGKGNSKKGGFIMQIKPGDDANEFLFNVGEQNAWFSEDNNFIALTPQGGSLEVVAVKILKGK